MTIRSVGQIVYKGYSAIFAPPHEGGERDPTRLASKKSNPSTVGAAETDEPRKRSFASGDQVGREH